jgi:hypothetical protein
MSKLAAAANELLAIRIAVLKLDVFVKRSGVPQDDPAYASNIEKLQSLLDRVDRLIPTLSHTRGASLAFKAEEDRLKQTAGQLRRLLEDLMKKNGLLSPLDGGGAMLDNLQQRNEQIRSLQETAQTLSHPPGMSYLPLGHLAVTPEGSVMAVAVTLGALLLALKRKKKKL